MYGAYPPDAEALKAKKGGGKGKKGSYYGADYVNGDANQAYLDEKADRTLSMPSLFVHATYDYVCDTTTTGFANPMREFCKNLTERRLDCGHWMAQEKPTELNGILAEWLQAKASYPATR